MIQTNLRELTRETVNLLIKGGNSFSVFDVTTKIREVLGLGILEIPELRVVGEAYEFEVPHASVKNIFQDLFTNDEFAQPLNRQFNGQFFEYEGAGTAYATQPQTPVVQPSTSGGTPVSPTVSRTLPLVGLDASVVTSRVKTYLLNQKAAGRPIQGVSVKRVQSAIKRGNEYVGWTCSQLRPIVNQIAASI